MTRADSIKNLYAFFQASGTGSIQASGPDHEFLVGLRGGRVVCAEGVNGLMDGLPLGDAPLRGDLAGDLGVALARGVYPDEAFRAAGRGLGRALITALETEGVEITCDTEWSSPPGAFALPVEPLRMLADAYAGSERARGAAARLAGFGDHAVSSARPHGARVRGLDPIEQALYEGAGSSTLGELIADIARGQSARESRAWIAADLLFSLGLLELEAAPRRAVPAAVGASTAPQSARGEGAGEAAGGRRNSAREYTELRDRLEAFSKQRSLEILGLIDIPRPAALTMDVVVEAYREVGARYHPDRYARSNAKVKALAALVFDKVTSAYEAIRKPGVLEEEIARLEATRRGEAYVSEMDAQKALVFFRKAEAATQRRNWSGALELINRSVELDARPPSPRMLQVLCRFVARELPAKEAVAAMRSMPATTPRQEAERFLMVGRVLKLAGQEEKAVLRFRKVLELIPEHPEARREVWLFEKRNTTGSSGLASLFSRRG